MDAFFAAIEEREKPWLAGLPVVIGADPQNGRGRGVVSTANYRARAYGICSAMPISKAWRLSEEARRGRNPPAVFLKPNIERYAEVGKEIMAILRKSVPRIEEASIDESYLDLSFCGDIAEAEKLCRMLKKEIRETQGLTASVGIGPNKLIAKIASDLQKPDGLTVVEEKDAEEFLSPLPIRKIPGIGPKTEALFLKQGIKSVCDLKGFSREALQEMLGKWGSALYEAIRGRDDSPLVEQYVAKSIGEQETFSRDTRNPNLICERLTAMCRSVFERLEREGFMSFRTVVVIVRFSNFDTRSRARTLPAPASRLKPLQSEALRLILPFLDSRENPKGRAIRLIGVRLEKLG